MQSNPNSSGRSKKQTTPKRDTTYQKTKITHPYHPRCGEEVKIIRKCRGDNILVETTGGERVVVALDWIKTRDEGSCESQESTHLLDYRGLIQALELIECLRQRGKAMACRTEEEDYDGSSNAEHSQGKMKNLRRRSHDSNKSKQRNRETGPGVGTVEPRGTSRGDPINGAVGTQVDRGTDRKQPEGGL